MPDHSDEDVDNYNVEEALKNYQDTLVPLHYHELWAEIVNDFSNVERTLNERQSSIQIYEFHPKQTRDKEYDTALIFGINKVTFGREFLVELIYKY